MIAFHTFTEKFFKLTFNIIKTNSPTYFPIFLLLDKILKINIAHALHAYNFLLAERII